jgi:rfaE bifunctional protein kinase chain/domain
MAEITEQRLRALLARFPDLKVLVVGDFFLDKYLIIEHALAELSLETGLEAHQVVEVRCMPGAAGTVTSNLRAMDVAALALGVIGDDGEGFELERALRKTGVDTTSLIARADLHTPTYTKPMLREADGTATEINRMDIKNRSPLPPDIEDQIIARLRAITPEVQAVIIADQAPEANCGVVTDRVRTELATLARSLPAVVFAADSRCRIGLFRDVIIKPNEREATQALYPGESLDMSRLADCGRALRQRSGRSVFLTVGEKGILVFSEEGEAHVEAWPVRGPIDIVGAGDATMAGIAAALAAGASDVEAARIGTLASAVTIQVIGATGTASRADMLRVWRGG